MTAKTRSIRDMPAESPDGRGRKIPEEVADDSREDRE